MPRADSEYLFFYGHSKTTPYGCFSQWYPSPFEDEERLPGHVFPTAEHYMMWRKVN